ncbi:MAG TPA: hypothetical protein VHM20_07005, partial [Gammaproteobacteria bacterium]|nr:hypothetical protein [Gammaproteobacteria bacterium]
MDSRNLDELHNPRKEFKLTKEEQHSKVYFNKINPIVHQQYVTHDKSASHAMAMEYIRPISVMSVKQKIPKRFKFINEFFTNLVEEIYETLWITFSFDKLDLSRVQSIILPVAFATVSYSLEELFSRRLGQLMTGLDDYSFIPKLAASLYIFRDTVKYRMTDTQIISLPNFSMSASLELFAILNLYISTYTGSRKLLDNTLENSYALLIGLAMSAIIVPSILTSYVMQNEKRILQREYREGSQRSMTTQVASGSTSVSNTFFQFYALLMHEMSFTRAFQLGLIANNILGDKGITRQLRNLPSMLIDVIPQILRKLFVQLKKIEDDFLKNTKKIFTLQLQHLPPKLIEKKIYELKTGDLVWCGKNIDFSCVPVSGEIFAFDRDQNSDFKLDSKEPRDVRVNLKTYTGENIWIKNQTRELDINEHREIDQRAIQDHKQVGILNGAEIDFLGLQANFFIRIARKKEYIVNTAYEKKAVINEIINQYKKQNISLAFAGSSALALLMAQSPSKFFFLTFKLLLSVFQMMIPFSESFLREMVNSKLMKKINYVLPDMPLEMMDALRVADFWNALSGYYADKFPQGVAIISDKTGTLTTT